MMEMDVNSTVTRWTFSFLTYRPQRLKISNSSSEVLSNEIWTNTGALQGCVLSPALFTLYTSDCRCGVEGLLQAKFSDDTSLSGMIIKEENTYMIVVQNVSERCDENILLLNISKTKESVIDFRRNASSPVPFQIKAQQVEIVHQYKYLGTILDDKHVDWTENSTMLLKKGNQRLYFLKMFMASAPSLALDPTFGIHAHKTLDTAQPCHLLKPNGKPLLRVFPS